MTRSILAFVLLGLAPLAHAQTMRGETLYRTTLLRAAPGRLLDLIGALKVKGTGADGSKGLLLRHAQGDHWDLMILQRISGYAQILKDDRPLPLAPAEFVAWQEDLFVRGPDLETLPAFREANLLHAEMFHALPDKRAELLREREMENAYAAALGRPQTAIFVRELGGSWDSFTLGPYKGWKHYAERDDIPKEKSASAAKAAGFADVDQIGPYLRSLILDHHDSLMTPVR
ncbi:MAG TPA: hypothetical protein PKU70_08380 [Vicinamibacteria bacterium]|nr:hypothetical protein [Vicinamibacteria bacterium]HRB13014.1 hypothetical protein [Vicinamibacteria bacterium]